MNLEPADVDKIIQAVTNGIVDGLTRFAEMLYRGIRHMQAPYYLPPPQEDEAQPKEEPMHQPDKE